MIGIENLDNFVDIMYIIIRMIVISKKKKTNIIEKYVISVVFNNNGVGKMVYVEQKLTVSKSQ